MNQLDDRGVVTGRVQLAESKSPVGHDRVTDGAVSPDGQWAVLRSTNALTFYRTAELLSGQWRPAAPSWRLGEPQGEGVTFGADRSVFLSGEGGGKKSAGTFLRLTCAAALQ